MAQVPATQTNTHLMHTMAEHYSLDREEFLRTVRATCGMQTATPEEMAAFLIVCQQYNLNPITREIYGFPKKGGGIVPVVSIDGWVNLVNSHPQCDGFSFDVEHDQMNGLVSITCHMHRKDRKIPVSVTEYLSECQRPTDPWKMQHRMLRHKALIQAARYAFGFAGIYDEDEGRVIANAEPSGEPRRPPPATPPPAIEHKPAEAVDRATGEIVSADEQKARAQALAGAKAAERPATVTPAEEKTPQQLAQPYLEAIAAQTTPETLQSWYKATKATGAFAEKNMPSPVYDIVGAAYAERKKTLLEARKANITTGVAPPTDDKPKTPPKANKPEGERKIPDVTDPAEYEPFVEWCNAQMDAMTDAGMLETFFNNFVEENRKHLMPPDFDGLQEIYGRNEQRLKRAAAEGTNG